mmetsp:Transcript_6389/g.24026  ORF Transcript_6389/g.24026 Transcript_6389/m.24026 type:complete len:339 (-) Transcript_6389:3674-4690(-)
MTISFDFSPTAWVPIVIILLIAFIFSKLGNENAKNEKKHSSFSQFADIYDTYEELQKGLRQEGLESSNLILGIDFTASNSYQGEKTFGGKSLHFIDTVGGDSMNQYQKVIQIVGRTLSAFDEDGFIPAYAFGDQYTKDRSVLALKYFLGDTTPHHHNTPQGHSEMCYGFEEVLQVYNQVAPKITLSGPTNFAPLIYKAIETCKGSGRAEYHILVIICDGQVSNEVETVRAIIDASNWPISIICIGVGDGPWECMEEFDDELPQRKFDNFQFCDYNSVMKTALREGKDPDLYFALNALMEIPQQFKAIKKLGLLGKSDRQKQSYNVNSSSRGASAPRRR